MLVSIAAAKLDQSVKKSVRPKWWKAVLLFLGAATYVQPNVLALSAVAILLLPVTWRSLADNSRLRQFSALAFLWWTAQFASDYIHYGSPTLSVASVAPISVISVAALLQRFAALDGSGAYRRYATATMLGSSLSYAQLLERSDQMQLAVLWKYAVAVPVSIAAAMIAARLIGERRFGLAVTVLSGVAAIDIATDARSYFLIQLLAAGLSFQFLRPSRIGKSQSFRFWPAVVGLALLAGVVSQAFQLAAQEGWLGARSQSQVGLLLSNEANLILSIRPELPQATVLILEEPLWGRGSRAVLSSTEFLASLERLRRIGVYMPSNQVLYMYGTQRNGLPSHAAALDFAVRAGILALPFWVLLVAQLTRSIWPKHKENLTVRVVLGCSLLVLCVLSPYSQPTGLLIAVFIVGLDYWHGRISLFPKLND